MQAVENVRSIAERAHKVRDVHNRLLSRRQSTMAFMDQPFKKLGRQASKRRSSIRTI